MRQRYLNFGKLMLRGLNVCTVGASLRLCGRYADSQDLELPKILRVMNGIKYFFLYNITVMCRISEDILLYHLKNMKFNFNLSYA